MRRVDCIQSTHSMATQLSFITYFLPSLSPILLLLLFIHIFVGKHEQPIDCRHIIYKCMCS